MRLLLVVLLCAPAFACRTSDLGGCSRDGDCSAGAVCDLGARVCVATDAPSFSNIVVSTPPAFTASNGRAFFDTTGAALSLSASISGRAGVDPASVCLIVTGETGACAHPGTAGSGFDSVAPPAPTGLVADHGRLPDPVHGPAAGTHGGGVRSPVAYGSLLHTASYVAGPSRS